jgi:hypothetical protein
MEFIEWYGDTGEQKWSDTAPDCVSNSDASQLAAGRTDAVAEPENTVVSQLTLGTTNRDAPQLLAGSADAARVTARLTTERLIAIQQEEAARGPPRSLHRLARDALKAINNMPTRAPVDLDPCFPWKQYVAAHRQSDAIIGPGITHALAVFFTGTNDSNRGGAPRLDFCFYRTDGTFCRVHPGTRPKEDADLIFENYQ